MPKAIVVHQSGGPGGAALRGRARFSSRSRRGARPSHRDRRQLHRRLLPARHLQDAAVPVRPGAGGRGRRRGGRAGCHGGRGRGSRRLREPAGVVRRGAAGAGGAPAEAAARDRRQDRRRHDAQGADGRISAASLRARHPRRHDPVSRGGRRRRIDRLPVGETSRPAGDRHGGGPPEGGTGGGARLRPRHRLRQGRHRRAREGADRRGRRERGVRRRRQTDLRRVARLPGDARDAGAVRPGVGNGAALRSGSAGQGIAVPRAPGARPLRRGARRAGHRRDAAVRGRWHRGGEGRRRDRATRCGTQPRRIATSRRGRPPDRRCSFPERVLEPPPRFR